MDYSDLISGLNVSSGITAIMGAGMLIITLGFAVWLTDTIASWFESHDDSDEEDEEIPAGVWGNPDDGFWCPSCGWGCDEDEDYSLPGMSTGDTCPKCGD